MPCEKFGDTGFGKRRGHPVGAEQDEIAVEDFELEEMRFNVGTEAERLA